MICVSGKTLQWRHNERDVVSNHQPLDCLLNRLSKEQIIKKTSKLRVIGLCEGNSSVTVEFPAQMASNAENVSKWWRHLVQNYSTTNTLLCVNFILLIGTEWWTCASVNYAIIGSDNGLSPGRRQPIIWTNDGLLLFRPKGICFNGISFERF